MMHEFMHDYKYQNLENKNLEQKKIHQKFMHEVHA